MAISAQMNDFVLGPLRKGSRGEPLPNNGIHWSISHTIAYVAAVVADRPIGIDVEGIKDLEPNVLKRIASEVEWSLGTGAIDYFSCRIWTAKEAVLKANGVGLAGLSECRVERVIDDVELGLSYGGEAWRASHFLALDRHIVSVTETRRGVEWHYQEE